MGRKRPSAASNVGSLRSVDEFSPSGTHSSTHKRRKLLRDGRLRNFVDDADDPFSLINLKKELASGKYGSVHKDVEDVFLRRSQMLSSVQKLSPLTSRSRRQLLRQSPTTDDLDDDCVEIDAPGEENSESANNSYAGEMYGTSHLVLEKINKLNDDCVGIGSLEVQDSKSVWRSSAEEMKGDGYQNIPFGDSFHESIKNIKLPNVENNLPADNRLVIVIDSEEEEEESGEHVGTAQASRCNLEALTSEVPEPSQLERSHSLDLDGLITHLGTRSDALNSEVRQSTDAQRSHPVDLDDLITCADTTSIDLNPEFLQVSQMQQIYSLDLDGLITCSGTTFKAVEGTQDDNNKHTTETVQSVVFDAKQKACFRQQEVMLEKSFPEIPIKDFTASILCIDITKEGNEQKGKVVRQEQELLNAETERKSDKGVYVGVHDDLPSTGSSRKNDIDDGLQDMWREMSLAYECFKDAVGDAVEHIEDEEGEECDHSFLLKDDIGYVCRVCGVIKQSIETIFDYQWMKGSKTTRTYMSKTQNMKGREEHDAASISGFNISHELAVVDVSPHPRHMQQMKPHQLQGFNFLCRNLISHDPGGCILAHAPGSGKTFLIISFIQTFMAMYSQARPLVLLPKGILGTWKREYMKWQVEDIPSYDFYSSNANDRREQLDVLKEWVEHRGILFLGYKQFSNIVGNIDCSTTSASCRDILIEVPTILIMDEGHTARTEDTDILNSLAKVKTPRKVILSGTLFQNSVKEVFTILNLVRPKFLISDASRTIKRRVMSKALIAADKRQLRTGGDAFFDIVEKTLQYDENIQRQAAVIQDLREMTRNVLHYHKGENLDDLPGLVDLTVFLNLSQKQKHLVEILKERNFIEISSVVSAVCVHPQLKEISHATQGGKSCSFETDKMDDLIDKMDVRDGVKTKFFLNTLGLCESSGEKLLVFSQYIQPMKFLERLLVKTKCWSPGKEIFMIIGNTNTEEREKSMERFNSSSDAKVLFGSIRACGEGISLVGASRILFMDVHRNPSVTRQAIGRAFRPGQVKKVYVYRLVASDSPEEENDHASRRKESISKMWFEWNEFGGNSNFEMEAVNMKDSDDVFWESPSLREDVKAVFKR